MKAAELVALPIRVYRALDAMIGNNDRQRQLWTASLNRAFNQAPKDAIQKAEGLARVVPRGAGLPGHGGQDMSACGRSRRAEWSDGRVQATSELERDSFRERPDDQVHVPLHDGFVCDSFLEGQLDGQQHGLRK